jgi:hypothetical protein
MSLLDAYLGSYPEEFTFKGKTYTPKSFADMLGVKADDYVQLNLIHPPSFLYRFYC